MVEEIPVAALDALDVDRHPLALVVHGVLESDGVGARVDGRAGVVVEHLGPGERTGVGRILELVPHHIDVAEIDGERRKLSNATSAMATNTSVAPRWLLHRGNENRIVMAFTLQCPAATPGTHHETCRAHRGLLPAVRCPAGQAIAPSRYSIRMTVVALSCKFPSPGMSLDKTA